jgi:putative radical SAM enzyme (TIGR03279 family)
MLLTETPPGLTVHSVAPGSAIERLGVQPGDRLLAIDGLVPRDVIDLQSEMSEARCLTVERLDGQRVELRTAGQLLDTAALALAEAVPGGIRECNNHCEFCFIRGLPQGLRSSLYVFDDDYRYSFLWGNFLTLTNLDEGDWARIGYQRLSPLNVSVHATDPDVRRTLLNNRHAPEILPQLRRLAGLGIRVNAQVVLCAGVNDGRVLDQTIDALADLYPAVHSVSVVPVGLTRYSRVKNIRRPTPAEADRAVEQCELHQTVLRTSLGVGFVYASDELYLLAGQAELPAAAAYDGFPVLSNGVGLLRSMLDEWDRLLGRAIPISAGPRRTGGRNSTGRPSETGRRRETGGRRETGQRSVPAARRVAWLTGGLAAPALARMADAWQAYAGWRPEVVMVKNDFFGECVTVSGLLSGRDLIAALRRLSPEIEDIVLPRGPFGFDGRATLDGVSAEEVGAAHSGRVHLASTPRELLKILGMTCAGSR